MNIEQLMNVKEVAQRLNVSPWTIRSWRKKGRIPFIKLNNRVLFDRGDINAFVESCKFPLKV